MNEQIGKSCVLEEKLYLSNVSIQVTSVQVQVKLSTAKQSRVHLQDNGWKSSSEFIVTQYFSSLKMAVTQQKTKKNGN